MSRWSCAMIMLGVCAAAVGDDVRVVEYGEPVLLGNIGNRFINESSGIVAGRANPSTLWTHNDSGGRKFIFACGPAGENVVAYTVQGGKNLDWEDIATAKVDGVDCLILADTGDNDRKRPHVTLYIVPEPVIDPAKRQNSTVKVSRKVDFVYEDGPHDCEAVAVDPTSGEVIVFTKVFLGQSPVYTFTLASGGQPMATARRIAAPFINMATGMDISPDGRRAVVVTYGPAYEFTREEGQTWAQAMARSPRVIRLPKRKQGESICYGFDGRSLYLTTEGSPCPLWQLPAK